jgi:hypothetical protein
MHCGRADWTSRLYRRPAILSPQRTATTRTELSTPVPASRASCTWGILSRTPVPAKWSRSSRPFGAVAARIATRSRSGTPCRANAAAHRAVGRPFGWPGRSSRIPVRLGGSGTAIPRPLTPRLRAAPFSHPARPSLYEPVPAYEGMPHNPATGTRFALPPRAVAVPAECLLRRAPPKAAPRAAPNAPRFAALTGGPESPR